MVINPEWGTKVERRKQKTTFPVKPRILFLIADLADNKWKWSQMLQMLSCHGWKLLLKSVEFRMKV